MAVGDLGGPEAGILRLIEVEHFWYTKSEVKINAIDASKDQRCIRASAL